MSNAPVLSFFCMLRGGPVLRRILLCASCLLNYSYFGLFH